MKGTPPDAAQDTQSEDSRIRLKPEIRTRVDAACERTGARREKVIEMAMDCLEDATLTGRLDPIALASADLNRAVEMLEVSTAVNAAAVNRLAEMMGRANVGMLHEIRDIAGRQFKGVAS